MRKCLLIGSAAVAALVLPSFASAQEAPPVQRTLPAPAEADEVVSPNTGAIHFGADLNLTTSYFFRGYNQEDIGLIFQPNVFGETEFLDGVDEGAFLSSLKLKVGLWNSLHSEQTGGEGIWYEADLYGSVTASFAENYYATVLFTYYTYPDDAFEEIQELGIAVGVADLTEFWDDSDEKVFTLPLEVGVYEELKDDNGEEDTYGEVKLSPTFALGDGMYGFGKPTISLPFVFGASLDGYYVDDEGGNEFAGYLSGGVAVSLPMDFVPAKYGAWSLVGGVNYIHLFADSVELANDGGEDYEIQGTVGLAMRY